MILWQLRFVIPALLGSALIIFSHFRFVIYAILISSEVNMITISSFEKQYRGEPCEVSLGSVNAPVTNALYFFFLLRKLRRLSVPGDR